MDIRLDTACQGNSSSRARAVFIVLLDVLLCSSGHVLAWKHLAFCACFGAALEKPYIFFFSLKYSCSCTCKGKQEEKN